MLARDLIRKSVLDEIAKAKAHTLAQASVVWLTEDELELALASGRANFGLAEEDSPPPDESFAVRTAFEAFGDGLVLMFVDGRRISDLDESLDISDDSDIRFQRLSAQRGG
jgi:hypothetical protein